MQEKALSEAMGSLRRVADLLRSTSTEPQEPASNQDQASCYSGSQDPQTN